jgi:hypothetical protein
MDRFELVELGRLDFRNIVLADINKRDWKFGILGLVLGM